MWASDLLRTTGTLISFDTAATRARPASANGRRAGGSAAIIVGLAECVAIIGWIVA